jgi:hypothetical protein
VEGADKVGLAVLAAGKRNFDQHCFAVAQQNLGLLQAQTRASSRPVVRFAASS